MKTTLKTDSIDEKHLFSNISSIIEGLVLLVPPIAILF